MSLDKSFEPHSIERRWYAEWEAKGYFAAGDTPGKPAYCIQLPPPNVTGTLHMGHAFQQTLMDALIRHHRMRGFNTNWVVGTDHAGIATQIVVERQLQAEGKSRHDLGREKFIERVWAWKQESGSTITRQMRRLGDSANWTYADTEGQSAGYFTMDAKMSRAVVEVFVRLYEEGLIYRGKRLVNWDPVLGTAVSDLEVDSEETVGTMWQILYPFVDGPQPSTDKEGNPVTLRGMTIATTRPRNDAGRRRGRGPSGRSALQASHRKTGDPAPVRSHHPGRCRRFRRARFRHRLRENHRRPRFQRLRRGAPSQPAAHRHLHARRENQRKRAGPIPRHGPL